MEIKLSNDYPMYSFPWAMAKAKITRRQSRKIAFYILWGWYSVGAVCRELGIGRKTFKAEMERIYNNRHAYFLREMFMRRITYNPTGSYPDMEQLAPREEIKDNNDVEDGL